MFEVSTFRPSDVYLTISGYVIEGWLEITIKRVIPAFKTITGIRNKNTRVRNQNSYALLSVSLSQASGTNDVFSEIVKQDLIHGTGKLGISLIDKSGSSVFKSNEAYIAGFPDSTYVDDIVPRNWEIECLSSEFHVGGNSNPPADVLGTIFRTLGL